MSCGEKDNARHSCLCGIDSHGCRGVSGGCAGNDVLAELLCHGNTKGHSSVLERTRRVHTLVLDVEVL